MNNILYKEIKGYKNLNNYFIVSKIINKNINILGEKHVLLNFKSNKNNNSFRILYKMLSYKDLIKYNKIVYNSDLKGFNFDNFLNTKYTDNQININYSLQYLYLNKMFIKKNYNLNKYLFFNIERQANYDILKNNKLNYFSYKNIWEKIYTMKYNKNIYKKLIKLFLIKQSKLFLKKNLHDKNFSIKVIFMGFHHNNYNVYVPEFFKFKSLKFSNNKFLNDFFKKTNKKNKDIKKYLKLCFIFNSYLNIKV